MGVTVRPACRLVGVVPLETIEALDVEPETLTDGPLRWADCGGIEDECFIGEVGGEWKERLAGELCKLSVDTSGTDTVMNVSTSRELTTVSSPVCERSEKTRETEDAAAVVVANVPVDSLRRILLEDPTEDGCGTCLDLCDILRTLPPTRGDGGSTLELALEGDRLRPPSVGLGGGPSSRSDLTLLDVCVDVVDILRPCLLPIVISRSSERLP